MLSFCRMPKTEAKPTKENHHNLERCCNYLMFVAISLSNMSISQNLRIHIAQRISNLNRFASPPTGFTLQFRDTLPIQNMKMPHIRLYHQICRLQLPHSLISLQKTSSSEVSRAQTSRYSYCGSR